LCGKRFETIKLKGLKMRKSIVMKNEKDFSASRKHVKIGGGAILF
jgi:hypothetical protein